MTCFGQRQVWHIFIGCHFYFLTKQLGPCFGGSLICNYFFWLSRCHLTFRSYLNLLDTHFVWVAGKSENATLFTMLKYRHHQSRNEFVGKGVRAHVTTVYNRTGKIAKILRSGIIYRYDLDWKIYTSMIVLLE